MKSFVPLVLMVLVVGVVSTLKSNCHVHRLDVRTTQGDTTVCHTMDAHVMKHHDNVVIHAIVGGQMNQVSDVCGIVVKCDDNKPSFCITVNGEEKCVAEDQDCDYADVLVKDGNTPVVECDKLRDLYGKWGELLHNHGHDHHGHDHEHGHGHGHNH